MKILLIIIVVALVGTRRASRRRAAWVVVMSQPPDLNRIARRELRELYAQAALTGLCARPGYDPTAKDNHELVELALELGHKTAVAALRRRVEEET